jgi:hypothetical protein
VTLSYQWLRDGKMLPIEGERTLLPGALVPGATVSVSALVVAPAEPGRYALRMSLVQEGVAWFTSKGASPLDIPAVVARAVNPQEGRPGTGSKMSK